MCIFFWAGTVLVSTGAILFIREEHEKGATEQAFKICAIVSTVIGVILLAIYFIFCTISFICYCGYEVQEDKKLKTIYSA